MTRPRRILIVLFILLGLAAGIYGPIYSHYRDLNERYAKLTRELEDVRREVAALRNEKFLLQNDIRYVEKVVREELGLARPGEEVYKLETADPSEYAAQQRID